MLKQTLFSLATALILLSCSSRFVKKEDVQEFSKEYEKTYVLKKNIEVGNFETLNEGAKVRVYFKTAGDYIAVYAYPYSQKREEAVGKNILQVFDADFPDKKFNPQVIRDKLAPLIAEEDAVKTEKKSTKTKKEKKKNKGKK
ncbi:MAG TPA: type II secretion system-associated lipoprotein [Turneriella sp.]|nr:type II secretion system-associated lipoprotein [Turneriella sp.]